MTVLRISGHLGAGKSTIAKELANHYDYEYISTGGIFRDMAKKAGMSIEDFFAQMKNDPELEKSIDAEQEDYMNTNDNLIVDGRMAPWLSCKFKSINILLSVDEDTGIRRIMERRKDGAISFEETRASVQRRFKEEQERYLSLYGILNHFDPSHFDIIIDTTNISPDKVFVQICNEIDYQS